MNASYSKLARPIVVSVTTDHKLRLCLVGPMIGRNPGLVTTQGERLAEFFAADGYSTIAVSSATNRYVRLLDIASTLVRRRHEYDLMVLQVFSGPSFVVEDVASWLAQRTGKRIVMVMRGGGMPDFVRRFPGWSRRVLSRADLLVAPSPFLARALADQDVPCEIIPNVIDLDAYPYRRRTIVEPRMLWMRCFHEVYNPALAVRAFARVQARYPTATLVMAGPDRGEEARIRELAARLGVQDKVRFVGFLDMAGKMRESERADIFMNTNRVDNMPVSVVEACAWGLPVVATKVGGIGDLLTHEETGLLVPDDDEAAVADAIIRLVETPALASHISERARDVAACSSWNRVRPQWNAVFARVR